jgi:hypothetical protein
MIPRLLSHNLAITERRWKAGFYFARGKIQMMKMMKKALCFLTFALMLPVLWGCGSSREDLPPPAAAPVVSNIKIRVVDVSNDTRELYEVDVIGMMWNALEDSLKKRGMLWTPDAPGLPLLLEARILKYEEGNVWLRPILPMWGKTVLTAKCDVKDGGQVVASTEAKRSITFGNETFTVGAWRKIFSGVAEDLVSDLAKRL